LSSANFETHKCESALIGVQNIPVIYFMDTSCNGKEFMTGLGIDGILYTFEVVPRKPIPMTIPLNRRKVTDLDDRREGNSSTLRNLFIGV
jgi:hypothetical protein